MNNITAKLGQLLIDAVEQHIAPGEVGNQAYELLLDAGISLAAADVLSDYMIHLAQFVEPE